MQISELLSSLIILTSFFSQDYCELRFWRYYTLQFHEIFPWDILVWFCIANLWLSFVKKKERIKERKTEGKKGREERRNRERNRGREEERKEGRKEKKCLCISLLPCNPFGPSIFVSCSLFRLPFIINPYFILVSFFSSVIFL